MVNDGRNQLGNFGMPGDGRSFPGDEAFAPQIAPLNPEALEAATPDKLADMLPGVEPHMSDESASALYAAGQSALGGVADQVGVGNELQTAQHAVGVLKLAQSALENPDGVLAGLAGGDVGGVLQSFGLPKEIGSLAPSLLGGAGAPGQMLDSLMNQGLSGLANHLMSLDALMNVLPPEVRTALDTAKKLVSALQEDSQQMQGMMGNAPVGQVFVEGAPIAFLGAPTMHGTPLGPGPGAFTVSAYMIPVWRAIMDVHACPLVNPPPHLGGVVMMAATRTTAEFMPIARFGDMVVEIPGGPNQIGMPSGGGGGGGGGGGDDADSSSQQSTEDSASAAGDEQGTSDAASSDSGQPGGADASGQAASTDAGQQASTTESTEGATSTDTGEQQESLDGGPNDAASTNAQESTQQQETPEGGNGDQTPTTQANAAQNAELPDNVKQFLATHPDGQFTHQELEDMKIQYMANSVKHAYAGPVIEADTPVIEAAKPYSSFESDYALKLTGAGDVVDARLQAEKAMGIAPPTEEEKAGLDMGQAAFNLLNGIKKTIDPKK